MDYYYIEYDECSFISGRNSKTPEPTFREILKSKKKKMSRKGLLVRGDSSKDFWKKTKAMRLVSGAAAVIISSDLSIPPNNDICGDCALQKNNL